MKPAQRPGRSLSVVYHHRHAAALHAVWESSAARRRVYRNDRFRFRLNGSHSLHVVVAAPGDRNCNATNANAFEMQSSAICVQFLFSPLGAKLFAPRVHYDLFAYLWVDKCTYVHATYMVNMCGVNMVHNQMNTSKKPQTKTNHDHQPPPPQISVLFTTSCTQTHNKRVVAVVVVVAVADNHAK